MEGANARTSLTGERICLSSRSYVPKQSQLKPLVLQVKELKLLN